MSADEMPEARVRLETELAELRAASVATSGDRQPVELDQASVGRLSRMDAMQVQAMAQAADRQRQQRIRRVEAALERLADGDYGWCVRCGEAIASARLEADPAVPTCVGCAA